MWYAERKLREPAVAALVSEAARVLVRDGTGRALFLTQRAPNEVAPLLCAAAGPDLDLGSELGPGVVYDGTKGSKRRKVRPGGCDRGTGRAGVASKSSTNSCHNGSRLWSSVHFLELRAGCDAALGNITPTSPVVLASEADVFFEADAQVETLYLYICTRASENDSGNGAAVTPVPVPDQAPFKAPHTATTSLSATSAMKAKFEARVKVKAKAKAKAQANAKAKAKTKAKTKETSMSRAAEAEGARRSKRKRRCAAGNI